MIKLNSNQKELITFKGLFFENQNEIDSVFLNINKIGDISYSDSSKTIFMYLGQKETCTYLQVYDAVRFYLTKINYSLNINVDSFLYNESEDAIKGIIEGSLFGRHNQYSLKTLFPKREIIFNLLSNHNIFDVLIKSKHLIESVNLCRDLNDQPPNVCTPLNFAEQIKKELNDCANLKISFLSRKECESLGMNLFLSVGAGTVISAMYGIAKEKPKANIVAIRAMSENRIGGSTTLNSSIIKSMSGQTVEIQSTDAEGRLLMADCMTYAIENFHATKIITMATLTGSTIQALGKTMSAVMISNQKFLNEIVTAANKAGELIWQLPLTKQNYERARASEYADLINGSWEKYNTAGLAGAFLDNFTKGLPFVHLDIAGSAYLNERSHGTMVKTLIEYACQ